MWGFFCVCESRRREKRILDNGLVLDFWQNCMLWSARNLHWTVYEFLCSSPSVKREKTLILECVCYTLLLEILIKIQSTIRFLFALNRRAHKMTVKSQKIQMFLFPCVNSLLIMVLINQSVKEAGNWFTAFTAPVMCCSIRESVVLRKCNRQLQLSFINIPTDMHLVLCDPLAVVRSTG